VDSISNPQAASKGSGMYLEFLLRRAHSRRRVERKYWSGWSLYSFTTCSNSVMVGVIGPMGSGLPQLGFPRRLAMISPAPYLGLSLYLCALRLWIRRAGLRIQPQQRLFDPRLWGLYRRNMSL